MNENLNLTEILKDCPKGMKLYSPIFGDVYLDKIRPYLAIIITINKGQDNFKEEFLYDGRYGINGECMLFPSKEQRDWSKWHRPIVDGDIVTCVGDKEKQIFIVKNNIGNNTAYCYVCCSTCNNKLFNEGVWLYNRLSTEEEKQILFDKLKKRGYKWDPKTKTLEKLKKEKSDIKTCLNCNTFKVMHQNCPYSPIWTYKDLNIAKLHLSDETNCEFWREIPKTHILENIKFDPKTLQPFDKVIVRDFDNQKWMACLFSHIENGAYHKFKTVAGLGWHQCIPYNDNTKHLVGKMDAAPEFYRYWED